ncbi:hypothetical protein [Croceiramulus getboli]|nr:hypothetical protein P8624_10645 [Flavobacteriaceae bacterium YJPT1-3]
MDAKHKVYGNAVSDFVEPSTDYGALGIQIFQDMLNFEHCSITAKTLS